MDQTTYEKTDLPSFISHLISRYTNTHNDQHGQIHRPSNRIAAEPTDRGSPGLSSKIARDGRRGCL